MQFTGLTAILEQFYCSRLEPILMKFVLLPFFYCRNEKIYKMDQNVELIGSCSDNADADPLEMSEDTSDLTSISSHDSTSGVGKCCSLKQSDFSNGAPLSKKPSYLNVACSVNGYSSITTYDSKIRQVNNKSCEVSPLRLRARSILGWENSFLAGPTQMDTTSQRISAPSLHPHDLSSIREGAPNSKDSNNGISVIQERVERLYGPGALAQVFYSPRKIMSKVEISFPDTDSSEFNRKFKELSPCNEKLIATKVTAECKQNEYLSTENTKIDLPVLRHLSQEFLAQLPSISPKRIIPARKHADRCSAFIISDDSEERGSKGLANEKGETDEGETICKSMYTIGFKTTLKKTAEKDGNYFLTILKDEQNRLLSLSRRAEKYIDLLSNNTEVSEDTLGVLRCAAGKARLLVSQKMKQFEGLCHNNLNTSSLDKFPTTTEDLQGFWDMVYLQVNDINSLFDQIELIKENDWKHVNMDCVDAVSVKQRTVNLSKKKFRNCNVGVRVLKDTPAMSGAALKRDAQRKQLLELKRKHKMAMTINAANLPLDEHKHRDFSDTDIDIQKTNS